VKRPRLSRWRVARFFRFHPRFTLPLPSSLMACRRLPCWSAADAPPAFPARARESAGCAFAFRRSPAAPAPCAFVGRGYVLFDLACFGVGPRRAEGSRAPSAAAVPLTFVCFAHLRSGVTVGAAQSAAGGTRPLRRRGWPSPTRGWNRQTLLAYQSRPPDVLQLIQQPEGHSDFLLFLFRLLVL